MQTRTITPTQWGSFFNSLSRIYDGVPASLEILQPDMGAQFEVEDQPLRGISYDVSGVALHFATRGTGHLVHRVPKPSQVQFEEDDAGLVAAIDIDSDDGRVILRFNSRKAARLLDAGNA
jgi:Family of unknown function (DUF5335)